ncbi:serine/threonine protein kinase [Saprolegnia diclina VS20]|uniref:Serine/threonine protein kinase n=1 Tax=Saprolegnia diclina (strain VS20) TaxID=1156394 RepID=T0PVF4_SAPDV|nr:serine/threonine protein kinase [Saprolegnia diclina VS20]EQC24980.1 serine/threonine protein kinase [Saprolegnia diclina VS20]|eukprot:XP_008621585.1 serine/threonine protein kinase [Saprolegnia diclina VS20]
MPPMETLPELLAKHDVKALDSILLSCTAVVEGTDGNVLLRRGKYNGKDVVIHRMGYTADEAGYAADEEFTQHIARVLKAQSDVYTPRVLGHAIVNSDKIACAAFGEVQETVPCLVVDRDGLRSLHDVIASQWLLGDPQLWKRKITIARAILLGLLDFIARDVRHVDVTAHNVFLKPDLETPQFANVGRQSKSPDGVFTWYPPELLPDGVGLTPTTDVFAFGTLLYEITTNREPLRDEDRELALQTLHDQRGASGGCPTDLVQLIRDSLRQLPAERPSLEDVLERLDGLLVPTLPTADAALIEFVDGHVPLGQGAFGVVRLCRYKGMECAHKQLCRPTNCTDRQYSTIVRKCYQEMEVLSSLDPKYVPRFIGCIAPEHPDQPPAYLMEQQATFPWQERCKIALKIIQAIAYLHECGIEHLDLKSANIMLTPENEIRLLDLGESVRTADAAGYN